MEKDLNVVLLSHTPDPEKLVSAAAKLCYSEAGAKEIMDDLTDEQIKGFLDRLMAMGHASPIEHVSFTFAVEGVSRSLSHQLVRHRIASYSQKSQRYVNENSFGYIVPPEVKENDFALTMFIASMEIAQDSYSRVYELLFDGYVNQGMKPRDADKVAMEDARYILPNACETKLVCTMNTRSLLHFFNVRCCNRAQWEIRELAIEMLKECKKVAPILFSKAGPNCLFDDCPEGSMSCGKIKEVRERFKSL